MHYFPLLLSLGIAHRLRRVECSHGQYIIGTKIEEEPKTPKQIIEEFSKVYARRLILADYGSDHDGDGKNDQHRETLTTSALASPHIAFLSQSATQWPSSQKQQVCNNVLPQELNKFGPVYKDWYQQISNMESIVL